MYVAKHRFARISPRKVRLVANLVRGKTAEEALTILRFQPQRGARMLEKVIRSAMANAEEQDVRNAGRLRLVDVRVDQGPSLKRLRPLARGAAAIYLRRMSHITVVLE
jgi:large subunit ribosomal protein L22